LKETLNSQIIELEWLKPGTYYLVFNQYGEEIIKTIKIVKE